MSIVSIKTSVDRCDKVRNYLSADTCQTITKNVQNVGI